MEWDILEIENISDYKLKLKFKNGEKGWVDLSNYQEKGGVFNKFKDAEFFSKVKVYGGVLCWPDDIDIAPETIYSLATGKGLPDWMEKTEKV